MTPSATLRTQHPDLADFLARPRPIRVATPDPLPRPAPAPVMAVDLGRGDWTACYSLPVSR